MAQSAKFIDITRTYLPVDPQAFPESMHGTSGEDSPEQRIPASAYQGYNFLPTSYGYKSYFGTNGKVGIDALTSRIDYIFTFQNETFDNFLIALCEDGIWIKQGQTSGAWVRARSILPPADPQIHFEWTYTIISDKLFCYMQGLHVVFQIVTSASAPGYIINDLSPTFLNMDGQVGIFRAGGRLGFWDTADSVSWSSLDDYADFVPDIESLAGNALFSDVNGRIVTIRSHGEGFMVYASKSIVFIGESAESTYQWKPTVVLSNSGIAYPNECCIATPDTIHFAYTNTGLYKIDLVKAELIVPEVTDFLKESKSPIYTRILGGRYLFLQSLDPNYLNGLTSFTDEIVPPGVYTFPGGGAMGPAIEDSLLRGTNICGIYNGVGLAGFDEQQPGKPGGPPAIPDQKAGTTATPIWTCYVSNNSVMDPSALTFGQTPCGAHDPNGVAIDLCPIGKSGRLDAMSQDATNKVPLLGSDVYVDGIWTIERFIAVQTAIWDTQKANAQALIQKILNRSGQGQKLTKVGTSGCTESTTYPPSECTIGDYVADYSDPQFGFSKCEFWLTRYATSVVTIKAVQSTHIGCEYVPYVHGIPPASWSLWRNIGMGGGYIYATPNAACNASGGTYFPITGVANLSATSCCSLPTGECSAANTVERSPTAPTGTPPPSYTIQTHSIHVEGAQSGTVQTIDYDSTDYYNKTEYFYAYNKAVVKEIVPVPETAYCTITGWKYTKTDGTQGTTTAAACTAPAASPTPGAPAKTMPLQTNPDSKNYPISANNGQICSIPFEPVVIPGSPPTSVVWPDTSVEIPPGSFLLQKGSIAPVYPDFFGALVYDLQLKKWGKMKIDYKQLIDYQPLNDQSGGGIPYNRFGMMGGVVKSNGYVYLFDDQPSDSNITYGKIGYYRKGMTSPEEVRADFRTPCTGTLTIDSSLNGRNLGSGLTRTVSFTDATTVQLFGGQAARWHNITLAGKFDITYLEFRGVNQTSRR